MALTVWHEFSRFKYAEEFAHEADRQGKEWRMWRAPDREEDADDYVYIEAVYIVEVAG